jgi:hypothetical protein
MPNVERGCVTHHYACDCREAKFSRMEAENAKLRREVECLTAGNHRISRCEEEEFGIITAQETRIRALEAALRAIEWWKGNEVHYCLLCCGSKEDTGHAPDCLIGLALAEEGE